jgi:hypothetical protein
MRRLTLLLALLLMVCQIRCGGTSSGSGSNPPPPPPPNITVGVSPNSANVRAGDPPKQFTATVTGSSNTTVSWFVGSVAGGNTTNGTIDSTGLYTAPTSVPSSNAVTIKAVSAADASAGGTSNVTLWNPLPVLTSVSPTSIPVGTFTLTANGSNFVSGAQISFGGVMLQTTFVSATKLTATGTASSAGTVGVTITNPNPGSSASATINVQITGSGGNPPACGAMSLGQGASLNGFVPFPADNLWNKNIANATVDPNSAAIINVIGATAPVHPDFGSGEFDNSSIGIPYAVVGSQQAFVPINFTEFGDESDPGPMPIPANAQIEGFPNPGNGDRHVLVLDNNTCFLYELYNASAGSGGAWNAGSAAVWDLLNDEQRPYTWTSADAAGLPIFPGLARYDEVAAGAINHALRFTLVNSIAAFTPPASHFAATSTAANAAPMGMRMRLKSSFDISGFSATNQVILKALQQYGMIMADNGSNMFISGEPDSRWDNDDLHNLGQLTANDFEVVQISPLYTQNTVPTGAAPTINSFTASSLTTTAGMPVTLNWSATNTSYFIVSPDIGAVRGASVSVSPATTTTYTLAATNAFGRTTATVTITVQ